MKPSSPFRPRFLSLAALAVLVALPASAQRDAAPATDVNPPVSDEPEVPGGCGTIVTPEDVVQILELQSMGMYELGAVPEYTLNVPLTFHVVLRSDGSGGLSDEELDENIPQIHADFLATGIQFFRQGPVDVILSDFYYDQMTSAAQIDLLWGVNTVPNTINVYFVEAASRGNGGLCGRASFTTSGAQGVLMVNGCTASENASERTFTHELGHYFDLYHTHETVFGSECPSGSNCVIAGDLICDTPADPQLGSSNTTDCVYDGNEMRCGQSFDPQVENFMSYSPDSCQTLFTSAQRNRSLATLINLRPNLIPGQLSNVVWVDFDFIGLFRNGSYAFPENTLADGLAGVAPGGRVVIKSSSSPTPITVDQNVKIDSFRGTSTVGD